MQDGLEASLLVLNLTSLILVIVFGYGPLPTLDAGVEYLSIMVVVVFLSLQIAWLEVNICDLSGPEDETVTVGARCRLNEGFLREVAV